MRTTIAHGKSRYQQKDSTLWGFASTWEMRLTAPIPRPERTLTKEETVFCVKDKDGKVLARGKVATDPQALFEPAFPR